jgi:two-component system KDP operon response regulator KdpE
MSDTDPLILVIEDELPIRRFLRATLANHAYRLAEASTGQDGLAQAAERRPILIILDLGLPDMDGLEVTRQLREWSTTPIIVLSARGQEGDKIAALDAGADDYLTKPFGVGELLARVRASQRRQRASGADTSGIVSFGEVAVDLQNRRVTRGGEVVRLTPTEHRLLAVLVANAGKVMTTPQLLRAVWGPHQADNAHYLRIYMGHLRHKLENDPAQPRHLITETGVGYRLQFP